MKSRPTILMIAFSLLCVNGLPAGGRSENRITGKTLVQHVEALCSKPMKGRMTLNPEARVAAAWIAGAFEKAGLKPVAGDSCIVEVPLLLHEMEKDINPEDGDRVWEMSLKGPLERTGLAVVARLPGKDTRMKDEIVLVTARYDGPGWDAAGNVFPGADRNASGVAVLLEVARALRSGGVRRTVVFAALPAGEEGLFMRRAGEKARFERVDDAIIKDLVVTGEWDAFLTSRLVEIPAHAGATAFLVEPPVRLDTIRAVVNVTMAGGEFSLPGFGSEARLAVVGVETGENLTRTLGRVCKGEKGRVVFPDFETIRKSGNRWASNAECFLRKRIPALWITTGPKDLHGTAGDRPEAIVREQIEYAARISYRTVRLLANETVPHPFNDDS